MSSWPMGKKVECVHPIPSFSLLLSHTIEKFTALADGYDYSQ